MRKPREFYGATWWCRNGVCRVDGRRFSYVFNEFTMMLKRTDRVTGHSEWMGSHKKPKATRGVPLLSALASRFSDKRRRENGLK